MPDYGQILQTLGIQQPSGNPASGQASYPNAGLGFAAGLTDWHNQQSNQQKGRVEDQRAQLLKMIDSIPDSEENFLPKLKLKLNIQSAGAGSHWSDKVLAPTEADRVIMSMHKMFSDALPQEQGKPSLAGQGQGMSFGVGPEGPGGGQGVAVPPPVDNTGKLKFEDKGKWKDVNEVFQDETTGSKYLMQVDSNTGKSKRIDLGKAKTVGEIREETRAQARMKAKSGAVSKGFYETAVALSGIGSPEAFDALPLEVQNQYYVQAGQAKLTKDEALKQGTAARTAKDIAIAGSAGTQAPLNRARTQQIENTPLQNPDDITAGTDRTNRVLTQTYETEIKLRDHIIQHPNDYSRKEIQQAKDERAEYVRKRDAIRAKVLNPTQRLQNRTTGGQGSGAIPKATPGPLPSGNNSNDPFGLRN